MKASHAVVYHLEITEGEADGLYALCQEFLRCEGPNMHSGAKAAAHALQACLEEMNNRFRG